MKTILFTRKTKAGYNNSIQEILDYIKPRFIMKRLSGIKGENIDFDPRVYIISNKKRPRLSRLIAASKKNISSGRSRLPGLTRISTKY
jgi:hypothetical protein